MHVHVAYDAMRVSKHYELCFMGRGRELSNQTEWGYNTWCWYDTHKNLIKHYVAIFQKRHKCFN